PGIGKKLGCIACKRGIESAGAVSVENHVSMRTPLPPDLPKRHARVKRRDSLPLRRSMGIEMIEGESQSVADAIPLAHRLLFFIIGDCSPVICYELGDINFQSNEEEKTMKPQQGIQPTKQQAPASPIFVEAEKLFEQMKEFSQSVERRAYEYFEARGREFGHDLEDLVRAESGLMRRVPLEVKE